MHKNGFIFVPEPFSRLKSPDWADNYPAIGTLINVFIYTMIELSDNKNILFQLVWMAPGNALAQVQWMHKPADLWDITYCTR